MLGNRDRNRHEALPAVLIDLKCDTYGKLLNTDLKSEYVKRCHVCRYSSMVERLICNQLVAGSSPVVGLAEHSAFGDSLFATIIKRVIESSGSINRVPL